MVSKCQISVLQAGEAEYLEEWMKKWGSATIFVFSLAPFLPFDVAGIAAGALRFPLWKFLIASFLGKVILYVCATLAAAWGWGFAEHWLG